MRALKIAGFAIGGLVALLALTLLGVWLFVDPNNYKDRIAAGVKQSTGRSLSLPGELKLSVFPWIKVQTGEASLGNPAGFGDEPFLTLKHASLSVKLLPLLKKQLEVGRIEIDGLDLRLKQNTGGKGNWEDWSATPETALPAKQTASSASLDLAGINISNSRIGFENLVADQVSVEVGRVASGAAIPVDVKMQLVTAPGAKPLPLMAKFKLTLDLDRQRYQLAELTLNGTVQPSGAPKALEWKLGMPAADLDLAAQTLADTSFTAQVGAAALAGSIAGSKLIDAPALTGRFELKELAPRALMQQFGIAPPVTRDTSVLAKFAAQGSYVWQNNVARLGDLKLRLDDSALTGRFAYDTGNSGMDFALSLDSINLDRYQPPPTDSKVASAPIELPVDFLKPLRAKGMFNVGEIRIGGARLTQLSAGIDVQNAVAHFAPLKAQLYGGQYNGNIGIDMRPALPRLTMDEHMSGIDIAKFMKEYADSERLSGKGSLDVRLAASGRSGDALLRTLNGTISTDLANGAVEGMDLWYAIAQAQSLLQKRQLASVSNTKRTAFDTFKASAEVVNGVATTKDLAIGSQLLRIAGSGSTNLITQALDYAVTATVLKAPPTADEGTAQLARATIPVKITGTLADPKIRPDLNGMAKERVKQEVEKKKDELKDKIKGKLKGLLGR
ncbi:MAG: AsmA family protein [Steroidobacteraceae bacterium]